MGGRAAQQKAHGGRLIMRAAVKQAAASCPATALRHTGFGLHACVPCKMPVLAPTRVM